MDSLPTLEFDPQLRVILQALIQRKIRKGLTPDEAFQSVKRKYSGIIAVDWTGVRIDPETHTLHGAPPLASISSTGVSKDRS